MDGLKIVKSTQIVILGICFVVATVVSTAILSQGLLAIKQFSSEVIKVTGSAEQRIVSDDSVWRAGFSRRAPAMTEAFGKLKGDLAIVKEYLVSHGVQPEELVVAPISTAVLYQKDTRGNDTNAIEAYHLTQAIEVRSHDVAKVTELSRRSTELIERGIEFVSSSPDYFYTPLAQLKLDLLQAATDNARQRAERMAAAAGGTIGVMRSAKMGVFQITPVNSYDVSDYGINDTSSLEKKAHAVVNVEFAIKE